MKTLKQIFDDLNVTEVTDGGQEVWFINSEDFYNESRKFEQEMRKNGEQGWKLENLGFDLDLFQCQTLNNFLDSIWIESDRLENFKKRVRSRKIADKYIN